MLFREFAVEDRHIGYSLCVERDQLDAQPLTLRGVAFKSLE